MRIPTTSLYYYFFCLILFPLISCVSIPKAAPELSLELGKQMRVLESNHRLFIRKFFDEKRKQVDEFLKEEWLPVFAVNFFDEPLIKGTYAKIIDLKDEKEKKVELVNFLINTGPQLQLKLDDKRQEMMSSLNEVQNEIEEQLTLQYSELQSLNNSLTNFLSSASKIEENRNFYLESLGINRSKINHFINETDDALNTLVKTADGVKELAVDLKGSDKVNVKVTNFVSTLTKLKDRISGKPEMNEVNTSEN